jgi:hypothetical protein
MVYCESAQHGLAKSVLSTFFLAGTNKHSSRATMSAGSAWPLVGGALVSHGSLVRVRPASDATSLSLLCIPSSRAECDFLAHVTAVQGWVLDFDQHHGAWHIFLFCFLRDVVIPSEHMLVISCIPMSLAFGDFLLANRRGTLRSLLDDSELHLEREVLHVVAVHSKLLQLQEEGSISGPQCVSQACRYRDFLRSLPVDAWLHYVFLPDPSMLPSFLLA